jgi:hypothetical protein
MRVLKLTSQQRYYRRNKKKCLAMYNAWEAAHPEKVREYQTRYHRRHRAKRLAANRAYWRRHRLALTEKKRQCRNQNRAEYLERHRAVSAVYYAIKRGRIIRPMKCSNCELKCKPDAHHHRGYAKEHHLEIVWLCRSCHTQANGRTH